ncbi:MAG: acyl-CoA thioesterase, partial [Flavobacteriaceae bacterium]
VNAREDHLLEFYNLNLFDLVKNEGIGWVVSNSKLAFIQPALPMERVRIESQIIDFGKNHTLVELRMYEEHGTKIKSLAWMNFVHFNLRTNKVQAHRKQFLDLFSEIHLAVEHENFDQREAFFRKHNKQINNKQ